MAGIIENAERIDKVGEQTLRGNSMTFSALEFDALASTSVQRLLDLVAPDWQQAAKKFSVMLHRACLRACARSRSAVGVGTSTSKEVTQHIGSERAFEALGGRGRRDLDIRTFARNLRGLSMEWAGFSEETLLALTCAIDTSANGTVGAHDLYHFLTRFNNRDHESKEMAIQAPKVASTSAEVKFQRCVGYARATNFPVFDRILSLASKGSGGRRSAPKSTALFQLLKAICCEVDSSSDAKVGVKEDQQSTAALDALLDDLHMTSKKLDENLGQRRIVAGEASKWIDEFIMVSHLFHFIQIFSIIFRF
jgi:hypothetical protein